MSIKIYGIKNCNTVKKALAWLEEQGVEYEFTDYKKNVPTVEHLRKWADAFSLDMLINRRGTTWRRLSDDDKARANSPVDALSLMTENMSMVKRPVIELDGEPKLIGFDEDAYAEAFAK